MGLIFSMSTPISLSDIAHITQSFVWLMLKKTFLFSAIYGFLLAPYVNMGGFVIRAFCFNENHNNR